MQPAFDVRSQCTRLDTEAYSVSFRARDSKSTRGSGPARIRADSPQVWREEGLFLALKDVAKAHMETLARLCAKRARELLSEPAVGPALEELALQDGGPVWQRVAGGASTAGPEEGTVLTTLHDDSTDDTPSLQGGSRRQPRSSAFTAVVIAREAAPEGDGRRVSAGSEGGGLGNAVGASQSDAAGGSEAGSDGIRNGGSGRPKGGPVVTADSAGKAGTLPPTGGAVFGDGRECLQSRSYPQFEADASGETAKR